MELEPCANAPEILGVALERRLDGVLGHGERASRIDELVGIDVLISGVIAHPSPDSQIVGHVPHATHPAPPIGVKIRRSRK